MAEGEGAANTTAREVMEQLTAPEEGARYRMPTVEAKVTDCAPTSPNAYSDGSLKNVKGYFWGLGGPGVWWPGRKASTLTAGEMRIAEHREVEAARDLFDPDLPEQSGGLMMWSPI